MAAFDRKKKIPRPLPFTHHPFLFYHKYIESSLLPILLCNAPITASKTHPWNTIFLTVAR